MSQVKVTYECITFRQRKKGPLFCLFQAPANEIINWAEADPLSEDNPTGTQRLLNEYRVKHVNRFFASDPRNSIPTAVVIGLPQTAVKLVEPSKPGQINKIEIKRAADEDPPGLIIDGQHRVIGSAKFEGEPISLCVIALIGPDSEESAFQFLVINNKAAKVSRDHLKNLNLQYDSQTLAKRLAESAGLGLSEMAHTILGTVDQSNESPFHKLIAWPSNSKKWVAPQAIELAYQQIEGVKRELRGTELDFFLSIWAAVKKKWPNQWKDPKDGTHKLLQKVSIYALTKVISDKLFRWAEHPLNPVDLRVDKDVQKLTNNILSNLEESFWSSEWSLKELDTTLGRNKVKEALETIYDNKSNGIPWSQDISWVTSNEPPLKKLGTPKQASKTAKAAKTAKSSTKKAMAQVTKKATKAKA